MNQIKQLKQVCKPMKIEDVIKVTKARLVCGEERLETDGEIHYAFASDLMSDVLTLDTDKLLLITGLNNLQTIRTAEMADINHILFVRNKHVTEEMMKLAKQNNMVLLQCSSSMFRASGELFNAGLNPIY